jgi:hypothetical protein
MSNYYAYFIHRKIETNIYFNGFSYMSSFIIENYLNLRRELKYIIHLKASSDALAIACN